MKYLMTLLTFCALSVLTAQKGTIFKHSFKPNSHYTTGMDTRIQMTMKMDLPEDMKPEMPEEMGSMKMDMDMFFGLSVKTGEKQAENIPFIMTYDSISSIFVNNGERMDVGEQQMNMFKDMVIKGHFLNNEVEIDSISGMAATDEMKQSMESQMQGIQMLLNFPEGPMMIGDTFSQTNINKVPTAAGEVGVEVRLIFKLEKVEGSLATFSTVEVYDFSKTSTDLVEINGNGAGTGILIFDIANQHIVNYDNKSTMDMNMDMSAQVGQDMKMDISSNNHIIITTALKQ